LRAALDPALLLPVVIAPSTRAVKTTSPGSPGCVVLDGASTSAGLTSPVVQVGSLAQSPTDPAYVTTFGYHVQRTSYPRSVAVAWDLRLSTERLPSCPATVALRTYAVVGGVPGIEPVAVRYLGAVTGDTLVRSLVTDLPEDDTSNSSGPCVALDIVLLDRTGTAVQTAPSRGPIATCPGVGEDFTFGG
jgi:hypothetical protein